MPLPCDHADAAAGKQSLPAHSRYGNGLDEGVLDATLVKALAAIAVIIKQRRQMPGAYEYPMAVPAGAGSLKVKIDGPRCRSPTASSGNGFWMNGTLPVVKRR